MMQVVLVEYWKNDKIVKKYQCRHTGEGRYPDVVPAEAGNQKYE